MNKNDWNDDKPLLDNLDSNSIKIINEQRRKEFNNNPDTKEANWKLIKRSTDITKNLIIISLFFSIIILSYLIYDGKFQSTIQQNNIINPQSNLTNEYNNNYTFSPIIDVHIHLNETNEIKNYILNSNLS